MTPLTRDDALARDAADPLASFRDEFAIEDDGRIYLDGNSLGRLPYRTLARVEHVVANEWGRTLIGSWEQWMDMPTRVGDLVGTSLLGARPGEVVVADSTTVNLYKLAAAALDLRSGRRVIVTDDQNFPTDRYVFEGLAAARGVEVRVFESDPVYGPDGDSLGAALRAGAADGSDVALVSLSHVGFKSGALADMAVLTWLAHEVGALALWDVSHSVGSVPVDLTEAGADLAVGCTYKYLNAGPGAPAFSYVRSELQAELRQPIWGWFGQRDQFEMGPRYDPLPGIRQQLAGTPNIVGLACVEEGVGLIVRASMPALREKSLALCEWSLALFEQSLAQLEFSLASPREGNRRGAHVSLRHAEARTICELLIDELGVVPDFRAPDVVRIGLAPLYTRYVDVWDAFERLRAALA